MTLWNVLICDPLFVLIDYAITNAPLRPNFSGGEHAGASKIYPTGDLLLIGLLSLTHSYHLLRVTQEEG